MSINYVEKHSAKVDERFTKASITEGLVNKDYDFVGTKTVKVHSVPTVGMNDYKREGANRYGTPAELEDAVQEMTMGKDRSFTFTVDKMNSEEDQALEAGKALRRQVDEVIIPEVDEYRLAVMAAGAGIVTYGDYTTTKHYERLIDLYGAMNDAKVPKAGRVAMGSTPFHKGLKLDNNFTKYAELNQQNLVNGQIGAVDGMPFVDGSGRLPKGIDLMLAHPVATTAPHKLAEYKTHQDPPGLSGALVEGRNYFDAFVLDNKRKAIAIHRSQLLTLTVTNAAGGSGKTKFTAASGHKGALGVEMGTLVYKIAANQAAPALGDDLADWDALTLDADISATSGHKYVVALKDRHGKCIGASAAAVVTLG